MRNVINILLTNTLILRSKANDKTIYVLHTIVIFTSLFLIGLLGNIIMKGIILVTSRKSYIDD